MNLSEVEELAALLSEQPVFEITVTQNGSRIRLRKGTTGVGLLQKAGGLQQGSTRGPQSAVPSSNASTRLSQRPVYPGKSNYGLVKADDAVIITSHMVGIFHDANVPIRTGALIKEGQAVGDVETLNLLNEVVSPASGTVAEVLIEDGAPVGYGAPLFRLTIGE